MANEVMSIACWGSRIVSMGVVDQLPSSLVLGDALDLQAS